MRSFVKGLGLLWLAVALAACSGVGVVSCAPAGDEPASEETAEPEGAAAAEAEEAPLYERLGGEEPIAAVVDRFIDALSNDDVLNANPAIKEARDRVDPDELKAKVTELVCQATGGPQEYTGRSMKESHAHLNISGSEWEQMMALFVAVLNEFEVPEREQQELIEIMESTKADIVQRPNE